MNAIHFQTPQMFHWLWLLPVLAGLWLWAGGRRRAALQRLIEAGLLSRIRVTVNRSRRRWKEGLLAGSVAFLVVALARPGWNPKPDTVQRRGRDVVFLVDVSKSMLAEDLVPNRLERAKLAILDTVERLQGDRVGLAVFAGTTVVKCPLTVDYGFFRMMLEEISPDSVSRGGTMIGDALRKVLSDVFDNQAKQQRDVILITDGEDHESFPETAAEKAGELGVRLIVIGLGDETEGRRIPITDAEGRKSFLTYNGQEVWSKLDGATLRKMALTTPGGKYLNVATGTIDLGAVYQDLIASAEKKDLEAQTVMRYDEKFQVFLLLALLLGVAERMISERGKS